MVLKRTLGATCGGRLGEGGGIEETIHYCCIKQLMKGEAGERGEKKTVQRKSQVAGVRAETERTEARRNRGIGRGEEKISEGGD